MQAMAWLRPACRARLLALVAAVAAAAAAVASGVRPTLRPKAMTRGSEGGGVEMGRSRMEWIERAENGDLGSMIRSLGTSVEETVKDLSFSLIKFDIWFLILDQAHTAIT